MLVLISQLAEQALVLASNCSLVSRPMRVSKPAGLAGGGATHRGHVRDDNQDVIIVEPKLGLFAVLDGMGGANAGDVAARMAAQEIVACVRQKSRLRRRSPEQVLRSALHTAAVQVFTAAEQRLEYRGMGTTVVACLVDPSCAVIGHAGDSRAYLLRDDELTPLTRDHTSAPHTLTRNLGRAYGVWPDIIAVPLLPGDRLLLCSDGLHGGAPIDEIQRVLGASDPPEQLAHHLVAQVLEGEASDNVSAVVISVGQPRTVTKTTRRAPRRSSSTRSGARISSTPT
jgi:PPM family protein phosphatase